MLKQLSIQNYALIESMTISFDAGFNGITGETGAGKSILLGALGLVSGKRADKSVVRKGEKKCVIEASFSQDSSVLKSLLAEYDLDEEGNEYLLRRELSALGKSRSFINDTPVNLNVLKLFGDQLIDIHSQHENLLLTEGVFQLQVVDTLSDSTNLLLSYQEQFRHYKSLKKGLDALKEQFAQAQKEQDFIKFQFEELEELQLKEGEVEKLENELKLLESSEDLAGSLNGVSNLLQDGEENALNLLRQSFQALHPYIHLDEKIKDLVDRLKAAEIELSDIASETEIVGNSLVFDEERKAIVSDRLDDINALLSKHRVTTSEALLEIQTQLETQLVGFDDLEGKIDKLELEVAKSWDELIESAKKLSKNRKAVGKKFSSAIQTCLKELGMPNAKIELSFQSLSEPSLKGMDEVAFLFTANKGANLEPISKIASGGEISRVMLVLKSLIAEKTAMPTMVLDEIDTGISGDIAGKVAKLMQHMSQNNQLLVITHLPQIAAKAASHYKVKKKEVKGATQSEILKLSNEERKEELAIMLSGEEVTKEALANAQSLLSI